MRSSSMAWGVALLLGATFTLTTVRAADDGPGKLNAVMVQDFEGDALAPSVWVVNIPNDHASVKLVEAEQGQGKQALELTYKFVDEGGYQYLGIPTPVRMQAPAQKLSIRVRGDGSNCPYGIQVIDAVGETLQRFPSDHTGTIDFKGWKTITFDLTKSGESWGKHKNGKIDYPISKINVSIAQPTGDGPRAVSSKVIFDSIVAHTSASAGEMLGGEIKVTSPAYGGDIRGDTTLKLSALGFSAATVSCWNAEGKFGKRVDIGTVSLDEEGNGSIVFPAEKFPHGPLTITISGDNGTGQDNCYLQVYNTGGIKWMAGAPEEAPPAAKGMKLVFEDDFENADPSISKYGRGTKYGAHTIGWKDFSGIPFADPQDGDRNPFMQRDTWLRIRASEKKNSTGLIASIDQDKKGFTATAPAYFECRFIAQSAVGTWPAFWLLTNRVDTKRPDVPGGDELDIIEAYGGEGPGNPNSNGHYMIATHWWGQGPDGESDTTQPGFYGPVSTKDLKNKGGGGATWWETPHIYAVLVGLEDTIYYCDDIEMARHKTSNLCKTEPLYFLVNLAIGGSSGWKKDLSRYNGIADMYVDYIRVYEGN